MAERLMTAWLVPTRIDNRKVRFLQVRYGLGTEGHNAVIGNGSIWFEPNLLRHAAVVNCNSIDAFTI